MVLDCAKFVTAYADEYTTKFELFFYGYHDVPVGQYGYMNF